MIYYRDPVTGQPAEPPPGLLAPAPSAISPQAEGGPGSGWRQTPSAMPGGGWKLEGPGLMQRMTATVGPDGKLRVDCGPVASGEER